MEEGVNGGQLCNGCMCRKGVPPEPCLPPGSEGLRWTSDKRAFYHSELKVLSSYHKNIACCELEKKMAVSLE